MLVRTTPRPREWRRWGTALWLACAAVLLALHGWRLSADFPNYSRWMDWSKYTDEGWYGAAAIHHYVRGRWYVPGDFNPAVALPVWPLLEAGFFGLTGVSLAAARGLTLLVFAASLGMLYLLVRRHAARRTAALAMTLMLASSFVYAFSRLAILEPLLVLLHLTALYAASREGWRWRVGLGLLLPAMVLTKTTAVFLLPAVAYLFWSTEMVAARRSLRQLAGPAAVVLGLAATLGGGYWLAVMHSRYATDFRYVFSANPSPPLAWNKLLLALAATLAKGMWIDPALYLLAGLLMIACTVAARRVWHHPLFVAAVLSFAGYFSFIALHGTMQPRYFLPMAAPLFLVVSLGTEALARRSAVWGTLALGWVAMAVLGNTAEMVHFALTPQYSFLRMADEVTRVVRSDQQANPLLLSVSGGEIELATGLPAICDDFGTLPLDQRIAKYRPGWYAAWNDLDAGTLEDLHTLYRLQQVASFPALDDPDRSVMVLYRLLPREAGKGDEIRTEVVAE